MKKLTVLVSVLMVVASIPLVFAQSHRDFRARLGGFEEVPAISTVARGEFHARISDDESQIFFELSYQNLEAPVSVAHIHLGQKGVNGGISVFLCGGGGKPACPSPSGIVTGTITASDVIGPAGQGIAAGEFAELIRAIRAGVAYVNVHSSKFPGGEIRGQLCPFDVCLQDERSGDFLEFNSTTGDYQFVRRGSDGFTLIGKGSVSRQGCLVELRAPHLFAALDQCPIAPQNNGTARIKRTPLGPTFTIEDQDITNNTCTCP